MSHVDSGAVTEVKKESGGTDAGCGVNEGSGTDYAGGGTDDAGSGANEGSGTDYAGCGANEGSETADANNEAVDKGSEPDEVGNCSELTDSIDVGDGIDEVDFGIKLTLLQSCVRGKLTPSVST